MEVIPAAQEYGLGVIPWSPLHGGLLGGVIRKTTEGGRRASGRAADALADAATRAQLQSYEDLLEKHGLEPGEAALAALTRPGITGPIVGPRTAEQLAHARAPWNWNSPRPYSPAWTRSSRARALHRRPSPGDLSPRAPRPPLPGGGGGRARPPRPGGVAAAGGPHVAANPSSAASTARFVAGTPRCPASAMTVNSASGQARSSSQAVIRGPPRSKRPWMRAAGMPVRRWASSMSWFSRGQAPWEK
ncbi:hypothetical protein SMICM304S_07511 [Streptomyces microflavus]